MYEAYSDTHRYAGVSASEKTLRTLMLNNDEFLSVKRLLSHWQFG
jgi:hypothetical protein